MGVGKTTIGRALAQKLGISVVDTDQKIVREANKSIAAIFQEMGEPEFRKMETEVLRRISQPAIVITTGGGIVTTQDNISYMRANGTVILLQCEFEVIWERISRDATRPLATFAKKDEIRELWQSRALVYEQAAHIKVSTNGKSIQQTVNTLIERLKNG